MLLGAAESCCSDAPPPASTRADLSPPDSPSLPPSPPPPACRWSADWRRASFGGAPAASAERWGPPPPPVNWDRGCGGGNPRCSSLRRLGSSHSARSAATLTSHTHSSFRKEPIRVAAHDDEDSWPGICERDMYSLHRNIPALRRRDVDTTAIRQHYYPEGGWGWIVCGAAFLAHLLSSGLQFSFGLLYLYTLRHVGQQALMDTAWLGSLNIAVSFLAAPCAVSLCRRKWTRLTAVLGGLVMALACLFTSFALQVHQLLLSYGIMLGAASGLVRETSSLTLGHYFKRRREFVEMVAMTGSGVGIALFSVFYREAVGQWGWRLGLQAVTVLLCLGFFLGVLYRSASMYHPQRRAILHLKNQRKKVKHKKTPQHRQPKAPFFDLSPLRMRTVQVLMLASSTAALGIYTPIFYLALQGYQEGLDDSSLVLLQTFLGFATALGCVGFGLVVVRANEQCLVSRQYLCQAAMVGVGLSLLALSTVQGYHGYVLFVWLYGVCLGGFFYSFKVFTMESVRSRYFGRAWGFVQGAEAIPVLIGIPITGYINQSHPKAGYYFSLLTTLVGAALLFLVGGHRRGWDAVPVNVPLPGALSMGTCTGGHPRLPKSISFATPLDLPEEYWRPVRPCRSVPEGLGRPQQSLTVVEQITTSV